MALAPAGAAATQALRLRSTRSLWDPSYVDESWIGEAVRLVPRMHEWVSANYPGTKLAVTEYNWGALDAVNGALAQADVLGIFGREGLDLATLWAPPTSSQPGAYAFRMYLDYDGAGGRFGDVAVRAQSADQDQVAIYGAERTSDGALTLMIVNKTTSAAATTVTLADFAPAATARMYHYGAAAPSTIVHDADVAVTGTVISTTFPASAITLLVVPRASGGGVATPTRTATATRTPTPTRTATAGTPPPTMTPGVTATATPGAILLLGGKQLVVKDRPGDPSRRTIAFLSKDAAIDTSTATGIDPIADGVTLQLYNASGSGESVCLPLPGAGWRLVGRPSQPSYRYVDAAFANGPCKVGTVKHGTLLKVSCAAKVSPIGYSLDEPMQGTLALRFTSGGATWCAVFGGRVRRDSGTDPPVAGGRGQFSAKDAPAPPACPPAPTTCD